ncbi:MAG: hypothetical protein BGO76_08525 [Caedibacter sp. 38-128]|nr:LysR family transcriptional regulator [Holosporales bacterium]OJX06514.1 MAG: hypothetical protein BGO76_08525 [Caedibacter sp. 38-128]
MKISDLSKLIYFKEAAQVLSYTKAGQRLNTTPSSVQRAVKALEDDLGHKLFVRKWKGLALTPEGKMYLDRVLKALKELQLAEKELDAKKQTPLNKLKILTTLGLAADWVYKIIPIIQEAHPYLKIEMCTSNLEVSLESEEFDIYIGPKTESAISYRCKFITNVDFKLYASKQYLEKYGHPKNKAELKRHKLINFSGSNLTYFADTNEIFADLGDYENYHLTVDFYLVERRLVQSNLGIASIAKDIVEANYKELVDIFPTEKPISVPIYVYHLAKNLDEHTVQIIYDALIQVSPYHR